ncbi:MAG: ParB/RepB/Spo0J family partition protein [Candidatus Aquicultorales bacterium]
MQKRGLGRGLSALIPSAPEGERVVELSVDEVLPSRCQPRGTFDERALSELAESIKEHGILQPLLVRRMGDGYELLAGERRLRAAKLAGLESIPALVRTSAEQEALEIALIENIQREDLGPVDEARAYRRLIDEFGLTQEGLAARVGKNRSTVANTLRLLNLPEQVQGLLSSGALTAGHARAILSVEGEERQKTLAERIVESDLSVRQAESLAKAPKTAEPRPERQTEKTEVAQTIGRSLGAKVRVKVGEAGKGRIEILFGSLDELERLKRKLAPRDVYDGETVDRT